jgi:hypothetical protein
MSKRITISQLLRNRRDWLDMSIASLVLGLSVVIAPEASGQCRPTTPAPCAADGMCYPKRETWGNYTTHWRPYPGDALGPAPTRAEENASELQKELPTFIVPTPDKEDQRGPVRPKRTAEPTTTPAPTEGGINELPAIGQPLDQAPPAAEGEQPAEPPAEQPPGGLNNNLDLPGFGPPQSLLQPLPQTEDGLPALPTALSQAITMGSGGALPSDFPTRAQATTLPAPTARANSSNLQTKTAVAQSKFVTPTAANLDLTNPAAKNVQKTMDQELQQAIYYEASDIDSTMK